jgi:hypothetical protein
MAGLLRRIVQVCPLVSPAASRAFAFVTQESSPSPSARPGLAIHSFPSSNTWFRMRPRPKSNRLLPYGAEWHLNIHDRHRQISALMHLFPPAEATPLSPSSHWILPPNFAIHLLSQQLVSRHVHMQRYGPGA